MLRSDMIQRLVPTLSALLAFGSLAAQDAEPPVEAAKPEKKAWSRFVETPAEAKLETPIVHYTNSDGVKVDLIGAIHVGDRKYYEQLNELFKTYDVILYELVSDEERRDEVTGESDESEDVPDDAAEDSGEKDEKGEEEDEEAPDLSEIGMSAAGAVQFGMASMLDLEHQLDVIDYSAENFIHADMDPSMYKDKKKEKGETFMLFLIRAYKYEFAKMRKGDTSGQLDIVSLIGNMFKHDASTAMKLEMAKTLQETDDFDTALEGKTGSVILAERNKYALEVLRKTLPEGHKKIGIFYGAAHIDGMDKILVNDMNFKRGETKWVTAWHIPLKKKKRQSRHRDVPQTTSPANP